MKNKNIYFIDDRIGPAGSFIIDGLLKYEELKLPVKLKLLALTRNINVALAEKEMDELKDKIKNTINNKNVFSCDIIQYEGEYRDFYSNNHNIQNVIKEINKKIKTKFSSIAIDLLLFDTDDIRRNGTENELILSHHLWEKYKDKAVLYSEMKYDDSVYRSWCNNLKEKPDSSLFYPSLDRNRSGYKIWEKLFDLAK